MGRSPSPASRSPGRRHRMLAPSMASGKVAPGQMAQGQEDQPNIDLQKDESWETREQRGTHRQREWGPRRAPRSCSASVASRRELDTHLGQGGRQAFASKASSAAIPCGNEAMLHLQRKVTTVLRELRPQAGRGEDAEGRRMKPEGSTDVCGTHTAAPSGHSLQPPSSPRGGAVTGPEPQPVPAGLELAAGRLEQDAAQVSAGRERGQIKTQELAGQ